MGKGRSKAYAKMITDCCKSLSGFVIKTNFSVTAPAAEILHSRVIFAFIKYSRHAGRLNYFVRPNSIQPTFFQGKPYSGLRYASAIKW